MYFVSLSFDGVEIAGVENSVLMAAKWIFDSRILGFIVFVRSPFDVAALLVWLTILMPENAITYT